MVMRSAASRVYARNPLVVSGTCGVRHLAHDPAAQTLQQFARGRHVARAPATLRSPMTMSASPRDSGPTSAGISRPGTGCRRRC